MFRKLCCLHTHSGLRQMNPGPVSMETVIFLLYFMGSTDAIPTYSLMYKLGMRGLKNTEKSNFRFLQDNSQATSVPWGQHSEKILTEKRNKTSKSWDDIQLPKTTADISEGHLEPNRSQLKGHDASLGDFKMANANFEEQQNHQEEPVSFLSRSAREEKALREDELQEVHEEFNSVTSSKINSRDRPRNRSRGSSNIVIRNGGPPVAPNNMETDAGPRPSNHRHYPVKRRDIVGYYQDSQADPVMELNKRWEEDEWKYNKNAIETFARSKMVEQFVMEEEAEEEEEEEEEEGEEGEEWGRIKYQDRRQTAQLNIPDDFHSSDHKDIKQAGDVSRRSNQPLHLATSQVKDAEPIEENDKTSQAPLLKGGQLNNSRMVNENNLDFERLREGDEGSFKNSNQNSSNHKEHIKENSQEAVGVGSQSHIQDESKNYFQVGSEEHDDSYRHWQEAMYQEGERIQSNGQGSMNQDEQQEEETKRGGTLAPTGAGNQTISLKRLIHFELDYNNNDKLDGSDKKEFNKSANPKHNFVEMAELENSIKTTEEPYVDGMPNDGSTPSPDPCRDFYCKTGKVCQEDEKGKLSCVCQDPETCPSTKNYVCGTDNKTYEDTCQLFGMKCHLEGTKVGHQLHLDYVGACKYIPPCTDYEVEQFPVRMRDWLKNILMQFYEQDLDRGGFLTDKQRKKVKKIYLDEKRLPAGDHPTEILLRDFKKNYRTYTYPMHWHFNRLDQHPTDRKLTHSELAPLRVSLVPMEHCVTRFFQGCDHDKDKHISLQEWCHCFGIKEEDIDENLLF